MNTKRKLTMYCTPAMKKKLQALAKRGGCSMDFFIEACFRFAIYHFDGKVTEVLKLLLQTDECAHPFIKIPEKNLAMGAMGCPVFLNQPSSTDFRPENSCK
jgi:hypothetical protein